MDDYLHSLRAARERVGEIAAEELDTSTGIVIDVRRPQELNLGMLPDAVAIPMESLAKAIVDVVADPSDPIVLYCAVGERSVIAAAALLDAGYSDVRSLAGGIKRWMALGLPTVSDTGMNDATRRRYARHIVLPEVGVSGQQKLLDSRVLVVGTGGLGSPAALYLAAAGVGTIGLVDDDIVEISNLQRQIIHTIDAAGQPKTTSAAQRLTQLNPDIAIELHEVRLTADNALGIMATYDIVLDGTDNFATRYLINDASLHLLIPVVHGSVFRFEGQVAVFKPYETACYRCLFPKPPPADLAPNCAESGVFGVLPGVIGTMQATEVLKLILGIGDPLAGRLLSYSALDQSTHVVRLKRRKNCEACGGNPPTLRNEYEYC